MNMLQTKFQSNNKAAKRSYPYINIHRIVSLTTERSVYKKTVNSFGAQYFIFCISKSAG